MKRFGIILAISAFVAAAFIQMNLNKKENLKNNSDVQGEYKFPKKVQAVVDKSCFGCHSENGKSDDAKDALRWDKMGEYDKAKLVSVFDGIIETIEKEEMPPKKMIERKPEIKPTEKEYEVLLKWAEKEADKLLN